MRPFNVLITAGSRRVPLVRLFQSALRDLGLQGNVFVSDVNPLSPAVHVADRAFRVPLASDESYLDAVLAVCQANDIRLVVPTIDDELPAFGAARERFARHGIIVACSAEEVAVVCNDKLATATVLAERRVPAAATFLPGQLPSRAALPLFVKPRWGRGSVGAFPARTMRELDFFAGYVEHAIIQQYLDGPEFTIDLLCGLDGAPLSIVPRQRVVIRAGVTDRGRTVHDERLIDLAIRCAGALTFVGAVNIQCRVVDDIPIIFEINPRFSGGIPLTIAAGADFPRMLIDLALGRRVEPRIGAFVDNLWMTSFEASLFVDSQALDVLRSVDRELVRHAS